MISARQIKSLTLKFFNNDTLNRNCSATVSGAEAMWIVLNCPNNQSDYSNSADNIRLTAAFVGDRQTTTYVTICDFKIFGGKLKASIRKLNPEMARLSNALISATRYSMIIHAVLAVY